MALETLVAGRYSGTYNSVDVGITETGFEIEQGSKAQLVDETDAYGQSIIDFVYRGGDVYLGFESKAYKAGSLTPFWPWGSLGVMRDDATPIGRLASAVASATVLTSVANTPAAAAPASLTGTLSILAPNSNPKLLYNSKVRNVPVRLILLPYTASTATKWFTMT